MEELSSEALARAEPNLRPGLAGALRVPGDRVVYPLDAARWLLDRALARGAVKREGVEAVRIGARRVETRDGPMDAGAVVNAAGAAAPLLTPGLPIVPRKGHLVITDRYPGFCRHQLVELGYLKSAHTPSPESVAFNLQPRATGQMLLGSSREFVGFEAGVNRGIRDRMIRRALEFMPALARLCAIRTWTGFRPATPDNLPLIGRLDADAGTLRRRRARGARDHDVAGHRPPRRGCDPRAHEPDRSGAVLADARVPGGGACLRPSRSRSTAARRRRPRASRWLPRSRTRASRACRTSVAGEPRGVLCAMGICFECRVTIDGVPHRRACMELVREGMRVETGGELAGSGSPAP